MSIHAIPAFLRLNLPPTRPRLPSQPMAARIPRVIHQTWHDPATLPPEVKSAIATLRAANPGWDYRCYDDAMAARLISEAYGAAVRASYERIDPRYGAARADLFRYLLLYREGGVYLDIKSGAELPLDEIIRPDDRMLLCQWPAGGKFAGCGRHDWDFAGVNGGRELQQWHVIAAPGHPYLLAVIELVLRNIDHYLPALHGTGQNGVLRLTGPIAYTLAIAPLLARGLHRRAEDHLALGLRYSLYDDNTRHRSLSARHYSGLTAPIVRPHWPGRALSGCVALLERVRRPARSSVRQPPA